VGDTVGLFASVDGASWATLSSARYANLPHKLYLGLVVCGLKNGTACTARFTDVRITGGDGREKPVAPAAPAALCGAPGDGQVPLRWLESPGATAYVVKRSQRSGGPYQSLATVRGTSYVDRAVKNGLAYHYVIAAVNPAGEGAVSAEESVTPDPSPVAALKAPAAADHPEPQAATGIPDRSTR
jgi:hypothetical protein